MVRTLSSASQYLALVHVLTLAYSRESIVISRDVVGEGWYDQLPAIGTFSKCHPLSPTADRVSDCS